MDSNLKTDKEVKKFANIFCFNVILLSLLDIEQISFGLRIVSTCMHYG
jgi:hypothetical protein